MINNNDDKILEKYINIAKKSKEKILQEFNTNIEKGLTTKEANLRLEKDGENVVVKDSVVKGEYLAWFSKNITFINCTIVGTQPFCYVENLKLVNCKMIDTDLAFEYSSVDADVISEIDSIKNPKSGVIKCLGVKEIINEDSIMESNYELIIK